jgi:two-component system, OmpR family, alkaline phosphatase synthesis response regulator PhoP
MPKILIVDDEPLIRLLLEQTLEVFQEKGVEILVSDNGIDALEVIKREKPNMVFLDVMMPRMNGFEVCRIVKQELGLDNVCIVMLTAKGQEQDRVTAHEAGTDYYVTKPFSIAEIHNMVSNILELGN